jgi:putative transposase
VDYSAGEDHAALISHKEESEQMGRAVQIMVSCRQRAVLEKWIRNRAGTPCRLVERARIILMSAEGLSNTEQACRLDVDRQRIRRWRTRWANDAERMATAEQKGVSDKDLPELMFLLLADEERPGAPAKFTAEQLTQIIAVACEVPAEQSDRPVTHWTPRELADEVIHRGIVESISPRHVDRILKGGICDPTRASTG